MTVVRYLGYATRLEYPTNSGVYYYRGDVVPGITQPEIDALVAIGHSLEEVDPQKVPDLSKLDPSARPALTHSAVESINLDVLADAIDVGPAGSAELATAPVLSDSTPPVEQPPVQ